MNIQIPYSEVLRFIKTNATANECADALSLSGPSIERVTKAADGDSVFDIEITSNRIDTACVVGIAQEALAILPRAGFSASWIANPLTDHSFSKHTFLQNAPLTFKVDETLCSRFSCVMLDHVQIADSAPDIASFLKKAGIRPISNVVDISNYLMLVMGQPVHIFDYDKIARSTIQLRKSKKGEKIALLDEMTYELPGGDIVIEDGSGNLIDLCGIMGGKGSEVDHTTSRILLFVQTYDGKQIRRTSMATGARSLACSYFERDVDSHRVEPTLSYGIELLEKLSNAKIASGLIDLYPHPGENHPVSVSVSYINERMGITLDAVEMVDILSSLGFTVKSERDILKVSIPFWRRGDIKQPEDILEEVARIYGYNRFNEEIPPLAFVDDEHIRSFNHFIEVGTQVKHYLRDVGYTEVYTYSAYGTYDSALFSLRPEDHARISNPISSEIVLMRITLLPSLFEVAKRNPMVKKLRVFELANVYKRNKDDLPDHQMYLSLVSSVSYEEMKGVAENIMSLLNIQARFETGKEIVPYAGSYAHIRIGSARVGTIGLLSPGIAREAGRNTIAFLDVDFAQLVSASSRMKPFARRLGSRFIEDLTYSYNGDTDFASVEYRLKNTFKEIQQITWVSEFEGNITIRIYSKPESEKSKLPEFISFLERELHLQVVRQPGYGSSTS